MDAKSVIEKLVMEHGYRAVMGLTLLIGETMKHNEETEDEMVLRILGDKVARIIQRKKVIQRSELLRYLCSRHIGADLTSKAINKLCEDGKVAIYQEKPIDRPGKTATYYRWIESADNG